ncbi:hypothetical protein LCGC14_2287690 [marine sediment metagenome]|uniref:Uncharacterized protein n=1 Tax=marine sediment metagenome TaxID=412755 RepID=A0A0F9DEQ2_9ZZZZ
MIYPTLIAKPTDKSGSTWTVTDREGGVWIPSIEADADIAAATYPRLRAMEICTDSPMRGLWLS